MDRTKKGVALGSKRTTYPLNLPYGSEVIVAALIGDTLVGLRVSPTRRRNDAWKLAFSRFVKLCSSEGQVYSTVNEFLCHLEALGQEILSQRGYATVWSTSSQRDFCSRH
jgi:hypothetical protein